MAAAKDHGHSRQVEVVNKSIFDWDEVVNEPCYFVGLEVLVSLPPSLLSTLSLAHL